MAPTELRAVTFDFWNTLIRADDAGIRDRRLAAWLGLLAGEGFDLDQEVVRGAQRHITGRFEDHWRQNRFYGARHAVHDMLEHLGVTVSPSIEESLVATIADPDPAHDPQPTPNVREAIDALRSAGLRIGIICDVGLSPSVTLRRFLRGHDMLDLFDHWSFSDEVGTFKPDPAIFAHARDGLGVADPATVAHVGDLRRTDVAGALGVGSFAVRYTGIYDDPGSPDEGTDVVDGHAVIADHADLPAALGLA